MTPKPPFKKWDAEIYARGYAMGIIHAQTGDPNDFSDARCAPLERERDDVSNSYPMGYARAAFLGGYEDGYGSIYNG